MFDIGFTELMVIGGVALVVLGPEKLAVVARTAGKWSGKAQRYVADVKADIAREGELAELRKLKSEMESAGREIGSSFRQVETQVQHDLTALESTVTDGSSITATGNVSVAPNAAVDSTAVGQPVGTVLSDDQVQASIQASLDGVSSSYLPPAVDMTGKYQNSLDATLSPPPLNDPQALRMEYEALQDDISQLEARMNALKQQIAQGTAA